MQKRFIIAGGYFMLIAMLAALAWIALLHFSTIEKEEVAEDVLQAQSLLDAEINQLLTTAGDYAGWDDTYTFVKDRNRNYIEHSLGSAFYVKLRLNLFCIVNPDGEAIYTKYGAPDTGPGHPLPDDLKAWLTPDKGLFRAAMQQKTTGGIIASADGLIMIAAHPVLTSESRGPVRGMLVIGRFLTQEEVQRIGSLAKFTIGMVSAEEPEFTQLSKQLDKQGTGTSAKIVNRDRIRGYSLLTDINKQPSGLLYLEKTRHIYVEAKKIILTLVFFSVVVLSLACMAFLKISNKLTVVSMQEYLSSQQYKTFVELAVDGIFRLDQKYQIKDANLQAVALTGYRSNELIGMSLDSLFSRDDIEHHPFDTNRLRAGLPVIVRRNLTRKGGVIVPVEIRVKYLPDRTCQCVMQDRTEHSYWEGLLHQQQELLNGIIDGTGDIIYAKNLENRYILMNDSGLRFAGKTRKEIIGFETQQIFTAKAAKVLSEADQQILAAGTSVVSEDIIPGVSGYETNFLATRAPLFDRLGTMIGMFGILHDISLRSMLEKELLNQHNKLGQLAVSLSLAEDKERSRIAEELHDQVGPTLLSGKMKLNILQSRLRDESLIAECEAIDSMIMEAVKEIRSLTLQLRPPILANAGLEAALKWLVNEFNNKYQLHASFSDDGLTKPLQYEKRTILFQVARELLLNVVKHAQCSSAVISIQRHNTALRLIVEDNGVGIDSGTETAEIRLNSGFGLFNSTQKLSHIHGSLTIDDTVESGARVIVDVPLDL